jgi:hypothetical protein
MVRRMLFAHLGAAITDVRTGSAQQLGGWRKLAHPADGQGTNVRTIPAKPNAKMPELFLAATVHADHIVRAAVAQLRTGRTGIDAVLRMFIDGTVVLVHNPPLPVGWHSYIETQKADHHLSDVGGRPLIVGDLFLSCGARMKQSLQVAT